MIFYIIFFIIMCVILLWVTIGRKEAWPFSWYPMYAGSHVAGKVNVIRIALQKPDGKLSWWQSRFYRYPEFTGRKLQQLRQAGNVNNTIFLHLERNRLLLEVLRLIESEEGATHPYSGFHIVERTVSDHLEITDRTVDIVSFSELKNGKTA